MNITLLAASSGATAGMAIGVGLVVLVVIIVMIIAKLMVVGNPSEMLIISGKTQRDG